MSKHKKSVAKRIIRGLEEFSDALEKNRSISENFTCRKITLDLQLGSYGPAAVKATRELLRASQAVFAQFLGVKPSAVSSWEQGRQSPSDIACRFMDEIQRNPTYWRRRLQESVRLKQAV